MALGPTAKAGEAPSDLDALLSAIRLQADTRLRYQSIRREGQRDGEALTLRVQGAAELSLNRHTRVLGEIEATVAPLEQFDDGSRPASGLPLIRDPEQVSLNRLQIVSEAVPQSRITAGRQRIELDDWRFLGAWPFTQNDQTLDAIRVETRALGPGTLDAGLFNRVNRKLGGDNPLGIFRGTSWYANYGVPSPIGRLTAFHYDFSLRTVATNGSSRTTGARILGRRDGDRLSVGWEASYARQRDAHGNPRDFAADYWLGRVTAEAGPWSVSVRAEELGSDAGHPVQTPLGALHGFNGLADRFLRTPADGLRDLSVGLLRHFEGAGPFETLSAGVTYHDFQDADGTRNYGDEIDLHLTARTGDWLLSIEHARYAADTLFTDTQSTVFSVTHLWGSK